MTRTHNKKATCFLCRYEITKHNKSTKQVKYNGQSKPVCKFCTKTKLKILNENYKQHDTQCKICKKPSLYKKCIACSICNQFYHGKCLDLNKNDIESIEKVNDFFICRKCQIDILPTTLNPQLQKSKKETQIKTNTKQCMTCKNIVPKFIYANKHLIYNKSTI